MEDIITLSTGKIVRRIALGLECWRAEFDGHLTAAEWVELDDILRAERKAKGKVNHG